MIERRKLEHEREFGPYLDILPNSLKEFPIFFDEDELSYLKGSQMLNIIDIEKKDLVDIYV